MQRLGDVIREKRIALGLNQERLAEMVGVKRQTVSLWEMGRMDPARSNLAALQKALGCSSDELLRA